MKDNDDEREELDDVISTFEMVDDEELFEDALESLYDFADDYDIWLALWGNDYE